MSNDDDEFYAALNEICRQGREHMRGMDQAVADINRELLKHGQDDLQVAWVDTNDDECGPEPDDDDDDDEDSIEWRLIRVERAAGPVNRSGVWSPPTLRTLRSFATDADLVCYLRDEYGIVIKPNWSEWFGLERD